MFGFLCKYIGHNYPTMTKIGESSSTPPIGSVAIHFCSRCGHEQHEQFLGSIKFYED